MNRKFGRVSSLLLNGRFEQDSRKFGTLAIGNHPTDDVAAVDIDDRVEIEVRLGGALKSGQSGALENRPESVGSLKSGHEVVGR